MLGEGSGQAMNVYYEIMASVGAGEPLPAALTSDQITRSIWQKTSRLRNKTTSPARLLR